MHYRSDEHNPRQALSFDLVGGDSVEPAPLSVALPMLTAPAEANGVSALFEVGAFRVYGVTRS